MMKKAITIVAITGLLIFSLWGQKEIQAETLLGDLLGEKDINIEVSVSLDFYDKYVWRGMLLDEDNVLQSGLTLSAFGFEGGYWGSWDVEAEDHLNSDKVDGWISYGFDLGFIDSSLDIVGVSVGHTWYAFPETDGYSKELSLSIALDTFLSPYFTWCSDYEDEAQGGADGNYFMLGISHSLALNDKYGITLDMGQELGYNDGAFIVGEGGYSLTTLGLSIPLTDHLTMSPNIGYSVPLGDLAHVNDGAHDEQIYGGVSLAYSF